MRRYQRCHCLRLASTERGLVFSFLLPFKVETLLGRCVAPSDGVVEWNRKNVALCVDLPHGAVINLVYFFPQFSVHPRGNFSFPLPPRHSLSLSAGTITFVWTAPPRSARSSVESAPRLLCFGITQVNVNVFGCSAQHFGTLFFF